MPPAPLAGRRGVRQARWIVGWALLAAVLGWVALFLAALVVVTVQRASGVLHSEPPGWFTVGLGTLVVLTPLAALSWAVLNVVCWVGGRGWR